MKGCKMERLRRSVAPVVLVLIIVVVLVAGFAYGYNRKEVAREQEYATQQARDELQQLKGEVRIIQFLSVRSDFSEIGLQEALKEQLQNSIERVENSDNQYLQDVSIPIAEDSVLVACDEATEYINHWLEEIG